MRRALRWLSDLVCAHPWLAVALFGAAYGIRMSDQAEFRIISAAPFAMNLPVEHQFLYGSPFTFFVGSYYQHHGLDEATAYLVVHWLGILLLAVSFAKALAHAFGAVASRTAAIVMLSSPLLFLTLSWFGKSDAYLLSFLFLLTMTTSRLTQTILSLLIVTCHRELGPVILMTYLLLTGRPRGAIVAGVAIAEAVLWIYLRFLLSAAPELRASYAISHASIHWRHFWSHPIIHLLWTFGPFWIYVVAGRPFTPARAVVLSVALVLSILSQDFTRVFVLVSVPLFFEITRDATEIIMREGGLMVGTYRLPMHMLWPLMFLQLQVAGGKLLWARYVDIGLGS